MEASDESLHDILKKIVPDRFSVNVIYHYTSFETFPIFFEDDADLYCTYFGALNDSKEIELGWRLCINYFEEKYNITSKIRELLWICYRDSIMHAGFVAPWVVSFSLAKDSLPQWIAYTDKKHGGYALGFSKGQLETCMHRLANNIKKKKDLKGVKRYPYEINLFPCLYSKQDEDSINGVLNSYFGTEHKTISKINLDNWQSCLNEVSEIINKMLLFSSIIKHDSFRNEQEIRLIVQPSQSVYDECFFKGGKPRWKTNIAKYINAPLNSLLREIWVSPHGDRMMLQSSAKIMKLKHNMKNCEIIESESPYNGR